MLLNSKCDRLTSLFKIHHFPLIYLLIYLWLLWVLHCCEQAFSSGSKWGLVSNCYNSEGRVYSSGLSSGGHLLQQVRGGLAEGLQALKSTVSRPRPQALGLLQANNRTFLSTSLMASLGSESSHQPGQRCLKAVLGGSSCTILPTSLS